EDGIRDPLVTGVQTCALPIFPAYRLDVVENDRSVLAMKVVVGTKSNPTPVLVDEMTTIVFSPYWNIPDDIAAKEIEPKVERDPEIGRASCREREKNKRGTGVG